MDNRIREPEKINLLAEQTARFLRENWEEKDYNPVRKKVERFINKKIKPEGLNRWEKRKLVLELFERLNLNLQEEEVEKLRFTAFTDVLSEEKPTPAPLLFFYEGMPLIKKHGIIVQFNLLPQLLNKAEELDPYKKHRLALELFPEDETVVEGISVKLAQLNFLLVNLLDKLLWEKVVPPDSLIINKNGRLTVDQSLLTFLLVSVFASLYEAITGEKQQFKGSFYTEELSKLFVKIKTHIKKVLSDREELEYLLYVSKLEEASVENRTVMIRDYQTQKNVFEESLVREGATEGERIESVLWLIGIKNINHSLLFRYYPTDGVVYAVFELFLQAQDRNFLTELFLKEMKNFLKKMFRYPYLSKGMLNQKTLDKPIKLFYSEDARFNADYFYFTQRYENFLDMEELVKEKDDSLKLKSLIGKYITGKIDRQDLTGWLSLMKTDEGEFFAFLFSDKKQPVPEKNRYNLISKILTGVKKPEEVKGVLGEEGYYATVLGLSGFYPFDEELLKLADLRFEP
ncbi:MAG: hypothetical protein GXN94_01505 [Aquificae bacterium]|nr:hypothetical protein [Aquificota bacterium]